MKPRILIVDDEPRMAGALVTALERSGYDCVACRNGDEALARFRDRPADVVVTDRKMPGMSGDELLERLIALDPGLPVILVTAYADVASAVGAMRAGAFDYVTKPFDNDELRALVARALELTRLRRENRIFRREIGKRFNSEMIAESPAMKSMLEFADRAAGSTATVLLQGESGTGKELIARRLHYLSERVGSPFVAVNCKALSPGLLESELFGHEKGAFTGASSARRGCFERADQGTLLLDEIGEVDIGFQTKLLRVLQEGEILPVGADNPRPVDVRIIAATNKDLRHEIGEGRFREDLFYRLNVIPIVLPPLRDRRQDILPLVRHFLTRHAQEGGRELALGEAAERHLLEHSWPGNVRELENAVERAVVLATGPEFVPADFLLDGGAASDLHRTSHYPDDASLQEALDHCAADRIRAALEATQGHRSEAAERLGIDRSTLFRWMKRLRMPKSPAK